MDLEIFSEVLILPSLVDLWFQLKRSIIMVMMICDGGDDGLVEIRLQMMMKISLCCRYHHHQH